MDEKYKMDEFMKRKVRIMKLMWRNLEWSSLLNGSKVGFLVFKYGKGIDNEIGMILGMKRCIVEWILGFVKLKMIIVSIGKMVKVC